MTTSFLPASPVLTPPTSAGGASPRTLRAIAREFAYRPELSDLVERHSTERTWTRLDAGPGIVAWLIRWPAGTSTGWHDHLGVDGPVSGAFTVVSGLLLESTWRRGAAETRELGAGSARSFGPGYVHDVRGTGPEPALSVHVYSPELVSMRSYAPNGPVLELTGIGPLDEW